MPQSSRPPESLGDALVADRWAKNGDPAANLKRIADLWSAIIGHQVTASHVALCMIALKISRERHAHDPDNLADIEGYVACLRRITRAAAL